MAEVLCRHFTGYKPCGLSEVCDSTCSQRSIPEHRILIVHLGALGAVLRSTSLLRSIHEKYHGSHITWITDAPAHHLLANNPLIDRILTSDLNGLLTLSALEFDVAFVIDKSLKAVGILKHTKIKKTFGFRAESVTGAIVPATEAAFPLWELGLSNHKKFFVNKKSEVQLVLEALELSGTQTEYVLQMTENELKKSLERRRLWSPQGKMLVGLNTGCSPVIPYKKLSVDMHRKLIVYLKQNNFEVVLLGGPEDTDRNEQIAHDLEVFSSPTEQGIRDGLVSMQACDIVVTGDSLGMHMAISLKKWVVAWFGPTCAHEIELYNRGVHVLTKAACSPCWKRTCHNSHMCYDQVDINELINGIHKGYQWLTSSSTPHLLATSSSVFHSSERSNRDTQIDL
jgi:heptosyltransferase-2